MMQRIITAVIAGALFLTIVLIGGLPNIIFIYLIASIAIYEILKMKKIKLLTFPGIIALILLWIVLLPNKYIYILNEYNLTKFEIILPAIFLFLTYTVIKKNKFTFDDVGFVLLSSLYVGFGFYYFIELREIALEYIFYALIVIWSTDTGAYFVGKSLGRRKLWPEISPNKTVEGSIGGIIVALVISLVFFLIVSIKISLVAIIVFTILLSIFGQIGDLVESALKRHFGVKDSGQLLPGHGGILDRFDSLLFVLPILYFLLLI